MDFVVGWKFWIGERGLEHNRKSDESRYVWSIDLSLKPTLLVRTMGDVN